MDTLNFISGNVLDSDQQVIVNEVNINGKFGTVQVAKKFPEVKRAYARKYVAGEWEIGDVQFIQTSSYDRKVIANLATHGRKGKGVSREAVASAFDRLGEFCAGQRCGCAILKIGGEWEMIEPALRTTVEKWGIEVDVYECAEPTYSSS
jgi:hypothetical protein